jgi:hypothetical protein
MIPQFTDEGLLPPGVHETDLEELKEKMGWSRKRRELLEGLEEVLELMASCGVVRVYLDGSFVTDKDRPNDMRRLLRSGGGRYRRGPGPPGSNLPAHFRG